MSWFPEDLEREWMADYVYQKEKEEQEYYEYLCKIDKIVLKYETKRKSKSVRRTYKEILLSRSHLHTKANRTKARLIRAEKGKFEIRQSVYRFN